MPVESATGARRSATAGARGSPANVGIEGRRAGSGISPSRVHFKKESRHASYTPLSTEVLVTL